MSDYNSAKHAIRVAMSHKGREINRSEAVSMLSGDARKAAKSNNVLNNDIIGFRVIGDYAVEIALVDFTGMRGCGYSAGVTVFGHHDLSELVEIDALAAKLDSLKAVAESFEAVAWVRREGAIGSFEQKWMTVSSRDTGDAIKAFRALGYETRGITIMTQSEASEAAKLI